MTVAEGRGAGAASPAPDSAPTAERAPLAAATGRSDRRARKSAHPRSAAADVVAPGEPLKHSHMTWLLANSWQHVETAPSLRGLWPQSAVFVILRVHLTAVSLLFV